VHRIISRRPSPAVVISLIALFVALGGTSYAVVTLPKNSVGSAQVINGSLQKGDLSRKAVAALKGSRGPEGLQGARGPSGVPGATGSQGAQGLPAAPGAEGLKGDKGDTGPPGPVDASQFVPSAGLYQVTVGPTEWQSTNPALVRGNMTADAVSFTSANSSDTAALHLNPAMPTLIAGKPTRLRAATFCWDATAANITITAAYVTVSRGPFNPIQAEIVGEFADESSDHDDRLCKRYDIPVPFTLSGGGVVSARLVVGWSASAAAVRFGGTTFEFDRAP
jgi:hypothetical protein